MFASPRIYRSIYPPPHLATTLSLSQYMTNYNPDAVLPSKVILEDDWSGKSLTYGGWKDVAATTGWMLRERFGIKAGDVVAISGVNSVDYVSLIHAVLWTGGTVALMSMMSTVDDFIHYFTVSRPRLVAVDFALLPTVSSALNKIPSLSTTPIIILGDSPSKIYLSFPNSFTSHKKLPVFDLSNGDSRQHTACICFSSGTSGRPKGVALSHYSMIASIAGIRSSDPSFYNSDARGVFFAPLCHIWGVSTIALTAIWIGGYNMLMKSYSLLGLLSLSAKVRANSMCIVPPIAMAMSKDPALENYDLGSVKYIMCTGAALKDEVIDRLQKRFNGAPIFQGYGMTETNVITTLRFHESGKVGSVGRLFANNEARLVDDKFNDVAEGQEGEMLVRGPSVFTRYLSDPKATREAFHDSWMKTGDVLRADSEGFFYMTDRKKELIKYKGLQVPPADLESLLSSHPHIAESAVCALWDDFQSTEVPLAYVTLSPAGLEAAKRDGEGKVLRDAQTFVDERVANYKRLRGGIRIIKDIPKTASGKVLRRLLPARMEMERVRKGQLAKL